MKIIDKQNEKYTKPENFGIDDFFYDELSKRHYVIMTGGTASSFKHHLICLETLHVVNVGDYIEPLITDYFDDTSCLIKFNSDQVTMNFYRN